MSLPKGGGAIRGIGEKFQANVATGTGSLSVPLATSPGRAGFNVTLSLGYDSGAGNGPFGIGWGLSVPQVTRKTDKGLPRYDAAAESDVFILSGAEDLVPRRSDAAGAPLDFDSDRTEDGHRYRVQRYRPRVEGLFARIERWSSQENGDVHWRATTKDNVTSVYGKTQQARVADPEDPRRVFSWLLEETRDDRGNIARYYYKAEDGAGVEPGRASEQHRFALLSNGARTFRATAQRYLKRIAYGNHQPNDGSAFFFEVVFDYGEHHVERPTPDEVQAWSVRRDAFSSHRAGFEVRTYRLCRRVLMFHRFPELGPEPSLVCSTDFGHRETPIATYLESVTHAGYSRDDATGGYRRKALPPLECGYTLPEIHDRLETLPVGSLEGLPAGIAGSSQWIDLDGEGLPGVLTATEGAWFYKRNLGDGRLGPPTRERSLPAPAELAGGVQQLSDLAGDGNLDLVQYSRPLAGYFERVAPLPGTPSDWRPFVALRELPNLNWNDPNLRFVDLDGDGNADVLITEHDVFVWYRSRAKDGFEPAVYVRKGRDEREGPVLVFADGTETIHLADMSGDGLSDIVRVRNGEVSYWPNLGYGRFGRKVTMDRSPRFDTPDQFEPGRVRFADIDGSGSTDVLYIGRHEVAIFLNESGNGFAEARSIRTLPSTNGLASISVVDLLGHGTACLVWCSALSAEGSQPVRYIDLAGGKTPHLLERIDNNLGAETRLAYASSIQYYLEDAKAGRPWLTRLPFPVQVLARVESYDHISRSKLVTTYSYHHGYFDGHEREFGGFACTETLDAETFSGDTGSGLFPNELDASDGELRLPPVLTKTWSHVGAWLERERLESALTREYYTADPNAPPLLRDTILPAGLSTSEQREAARALRGNVLRQEVYALDDSPASAHPYTVSEQNYETRLLQHAQGDGHAVFFVHPREAITLHYERKPADPRIQQALTLEVDDFGNVTRSVAIAYPRRQPLEPEQAELWAVVSEAVVTNQPNNQGAYRLGVPVETRSRELTGLALPNGQLLTHADLRSAITNANEIFYEATASGSAFELRAVERQQVFYYDDSLTGPLPLGQIGTRAIPYETRTLAFTPGLVYGVYEGRVNETVLLEAGYVQDPLGHWWAPSGRVVHDPTRFYLPIGSIDPFGNESWLRYDDHALLMLEAEDALHNRITAGERNLGAPGEPVVSSSIDYRVLAPALLTDPNGNRAAVQFDELGMVVRTAVMGKSTQTHGDLLDQAVAPTPAEAELDAFVANPRAPSTSSAVSAPSAFARALLGTATTRVVYDLDRFRRLGQPPFAATLARETHVSDLDDDQETAIQISFTYSDGFGREIQKKVQAEPGPVVPGEPIANPRWVGTGRTVFDNKGNPVKQYEPFFSSTAAYEDEAELVATGVTPILHYDPLGRLIRTDLPDGTHTRVEFDAWHQRSFDANDTVQGTPWLLARQTGTPAEKRAATLSLAYQGTPAIEHLDSLGRPFLSVANDGTRQLRTRMELDVEGNALSVTDARGIVTLRQTFDVLGRSVSSSSPDAGDQRAFLDVANKPTLAFTARGHTLESRYDELQRPTHLFVRDPEPNGNRSLVQRTVYGEGHAEASDLNLRGQAHLVYDGAGVLKSLRFDFKGNVEASERRLALEYKQAPDWMPLDALLDPVAIEAAAHPLLDATDWFVSVVTYDALNRAATQTTPDGSVTEPTFNEAGLLEKLKVSLRAGSTATVFVENIDYNARGQRVKVEYGNDTVARFTYDDRTFRLARQTLTRPGAAPLLQDLEYTYDAVGNIVQITDRVSFGNASVSANGLYEYDGLHQLVRAEGRQHPGQQPSDTDAETLRVDHPNDLQALERYREEYAYDEGGNILEMKHTVLAPGIAGWTRHYDYGSANNRLMGTSLPGDIDGEFSGKYTYDAAGNMETMPHLPLMRWNHADQLEASSQQVVTSGTPETTYYTYDATGQRVRKVTEYAAAPGGTPRKKQERVYLGGFELFRAYEANGGTAKLARETLHVMDDQQRVAMVESKTEDASVPAAVFQVTSRQRYQVSNHLGSASLELDEGAQIIGYEEYFPYGATSLRAMHSLAEVSAERYRYTGMERDEETGLSYHSARYYATWLGRWVSCDPIGIEGGTCVYRYCHGNSICLTDPQGMDPPEIAEDSGRAAMFKKYSSVAYTVDITPPNKHVNAPGVDAHFLVGTGESVVNVIGDTKYSGPSKSRGYHPQTYSGKKKTGHVSSFDNAAKQSYGQLVRNIRAALRAGKIDPKTAHYAIVNAKAGFVLHDIGVVGTTTGVSEAILKKYWAVVTRFDTFADSAGKRESLDIRAAARGKFVVHVMTPSALPGRPAVTGLAPSSTPAPVKLYGVAPGTVTLDPKGSVRGSIVGVVATEGPRLLEKVARNRGASEETSTGIGFWSSVAGGAWMGAAAGAPANGIGALPGGILGGIIGGAGYIAGRIDDISLVGAKTWRRMPLPRSGIFAR